MKKSKKQLLPKRFILDRADVIAFKKGGLEIGFFEISDIKSLQEKE